ncbi:MAG: ATP-binding protein [Candidatus Thiodiazotropha sp.]
MSNQKLAITRQDQAAVVSVTDSGKGIDEEDLPHIFEPFYKNRHAGLGLAIAQRMVALQGGEISVANGEGGGACFSFTLPLTGS